LRRQVKHSPLSGCNTKPVGEFHRNYCSGGTEPTPQKIKIPKKSTYAKLGHATETYTETYSEGCGSPTVFYGDTYKLTNPAGEGQTDRFVSALIAKYENGGQEYKGTLYLDVSVAIGE
jgi:hypothetical protein